MTFEMHSQAAPLPPRQRQPETSTGVSRINPNSVHGKRVIEHLRMAQKYRDAALKSEAKANERADYWKRKAAVEFANGRKLLGGQTADDVAGQWTGQDPIWKNHASDNRWHLDQANVEANNAIALMKAIEMGLIE